MAAMDETKKAKKLHNALFLKAYSDLKYCLDLFRLALSPEEYRLFDWEKIRSQATVFFDSEWTEEPWMVPDAVSPVGSAVAGGDGKGIRSPILSSPSPPWEQGRRRIWCFCWSTKATGSRV